MRTPHATCQKFLLKYFRKQLKIHEICEIKDPWKFCAIRYGLTGLYQFSEVVYMMTFCLVTLSGHRDLSQTEWHHTSDCWPHWRRTGERSEDTATLSVAWFHVLYYTSVHVHRSAICIMHRAICILHWCACVFTIYCTVGSLMTTPTMVQAGIMCKQWDQETKHFCGLKRTLLVMLHSRHTKLAIHIWQSQVEIEHYSVAYSTALLHSKCCS